MPTYDQINALYQQYLGRPASQDEANNWISGAYGATDLGGIESQIASSGEAQARRGDGGGGASGGPSYDQINNLYNQYLGRPASQDEYHNWISGAYGATDLGGITGQIQNSGEAQAYAASHGGGASSGGGGGGGLTTSSGGSYTPPPSYSAPAPSAQTSQTFGPWGGHFTAPTPTALPTAPTFTAPSYTPPPAFSYDASTPGYVAPPTYTPPPAFSYGDFSYGDFKAPTVEEALNDPGYKFRLQQGQQALENAASAKGVLNDSGTAKALIDYGQNAASQEYANVWNRAMGAYTTGRDTAAGIYNTNRGNAADIYNTNYRTQYTDPYNVGVNASTTARQNARDIYALNYQTQYQDPYAASYQAAKDQFAPQFAGWQANAQNTMGLNTLGNTNAWNDYQLGWQDFQSRRNLGANFALQS
jgi:hypothetical protein